MRAPRLGLTIGMLAALLVAPGASAAAPPTTTIEIDIVFDVSEEFTTTGGVLCPSGTAVTDPVFSAGFGRMGRGAGTFHLIKTLTCDNGSGTFQIKVNVGPTPTGTIGGFAVVGGTGAYTNLRGGGSLVGTATDGGIFDVYTGQLTNG
jgi:hypothetical protein